MLPVMAGKHVTKRYKYTQIFLASTVPVRCKLFSLDTSMSLTTVYYNDTGTH